MEQHWEAGGLERGESRVTYAIVIERAPHNFAAYVPDLPGCVATGDTVDEVIANIREAITWHIEALHEDNVPVPEPTSITTFVEV